MALEPHPAQGAQMGEETLAAHPQEDRVAGRGDGIQITQCQTYLPTMRPKTKLRINKLRKVNAPSHSSFVGSAIQQLSRSSCKSVGIRRDVIEV